MEHSDTGPRALVRADDMIAEMEAINEAACYASGKTEITKIRYSHDGMIDILIANPWVHQNELAKHFGYSPAWISTVMHTDMFQAKLASRRAEIVDPVLQATLRERMEALTARSLQVLQEKLSNPVVSQIPDNLALKALELGAKAMGMGGNAPAPAPALSGDHLLGLADRLIALQSRIRNTRIENAQDAEIIYPQGAHASPSELPAGVGAHQG